MKFQSLSIIIILSLIITVGCKKNDPAPATPQEEQKAILISSAWVLGSVAKDGLDVTDQFNGFKLVVGDLTYTTTNSLTTAWPAQGTWSFANESGTLIERNDGVQITVDASSTALKLTFSVTGLGNGGRIRGVDGEYVFSLVPG